MITLKEPIWDSRRFYIFKENEGAKVPITTNKQSNASITISNAHIQISYSSVTNCVVLGYSSSKIDITNYSKFKVEYNISNNPSSVYYNGCIGVKTTAFAFSPNSTQFGSNYIEFTPNSTRIVSEVDITNLVGEYYVGISGAGIGYIYNLWLE